MGGLTSSLFITAATSTGQVMSYLCPLIQIDVYVTFQVGIGIVVMQQSDNQDDCPACYWANCQNHAYMHIKEKVSMHA